MSATFVNIAPEKLAKLADQFSKLSWDDRENLKKQAIALYHERQRKAAENKKKKIPTHAKDLFVYKLWYTGNGGIPSEFKYSYFITKPHEDDIIGACESHFGSVNDQSSGFRGFKWVRVPFKDFRKLHERESNLGTIARKAENKYREVRNLMDFYLNIKQAGFNLH